MARETENLGLYLADDEDTFQNYVTNQSASMNHNMEILDSYIPDELNSKVDKVTGKTLSTNDYTDEDKGLVASAIQPDDYATTSSAGLVKPDGTTVTVDADGTIHGASTYTLPTASTSTKGGVKVGDHLHMNGEVLSADGGIYVGDTEPTDVDVWIDTSEEGADFCYVGPDEPPNDGSVAIWVDTSKDFIPPTYDLTGVESRTLLWTNPAPTNTFVPQTVSLDLTNYDEVEILYKGHSGDARYEFVKCAKGLSCSLHTIIDSSASAQYIGSRMATFNDGGITFNDAYLAVAGGSTSAGVYNNNIIPFKIYGIKKVVS